MMMNQIEHVLLIIVQHPSSDNLMVLNKYRDTTALNVQ